MHCIGTLVLVAALGEQRNFIHKRGSFLRRVAKKVISGVPVVGGVAAEIGSRVGFFNGAPSPSTFALPVVCGPGFKETMGRCVPRCPPGQVEINGVCQFAPRAPVPGGPTRLDIVPTIGGIPQPFPGEEQQLLPIGEAVMGRFGAGFKPAVFSQQRRACGRGAVLGVDGICYNRRDIRNNERFWPRGRRPLLTGGEMRCISVASRAAGKLQKKTKQLQKLGMLKKPSPRQAPQQKLLAPGHHAHVSHD